MLIADGNHSRECRPFLTRIDRLEPTNVELRHDPTRLNWAYIGRQPLDINPRMKFYVDLVAVTSLEGRLQPQITIVPVTWTALLAEPGKYRFTVVVSRDNVKPEDVEVTF